MPAIDDHPPPIASALEGLGLKYSELYLDLRRVRKARMALQVEEAAIREKLDALQAAASVFGYQLEKPPKDAAAAIPQVHEAPVTQPAPPTLTTRPTIRELVLSRLRFVGDDGSKASQIRQYLEGEHGIKTHEKTVGMTLYRLLKAGRARREGTTWFFVPAQPEKKNPGGEAPGSSNLFD